ncbi:RagB/SusD family nutrient uptake outer membrane protein [Hymenobacter armeniacus]|uniref:RagB/SusD family nutrient uptake outer membrane protein n=1 Tax=Hymenobacter armeniacus TaxID=2771358 RepID=A0ABR8JW26_9BACT|nr:RagB/SusD family nutrient uptake outer membrane protein [Hymenobacter armeniacus]MBD2724073.1 RagB/SusD family nutrient uptake outer membrane protein [Hymenobacter armeniacus]
MKKFLNTKAAAALCAALLSAGAFSSCQTDKLSPVPVTLFSDKVVFDTPARVELQANGLYSFVKDGRFLGGRYQIFGDIRANDFLNRASNLVTGTAVWNHTLTETSQNDVINTWGVGYAAINQINVFLAGLDANASKFIAPIFPADYVTKANNYRGEARLLRALCYYSLLQLYARPYADGNGSKPGLPLRLRAEIDDTGNDLARSSVADVYTQILADLDFAETSLPLTYGTSATTLNVTRAHRNTAIALKTRVYLSMGRYADVIREANKLVPAAAPYAAPSGVPNALNASVAAVFTGTQETTESILSFPFTVADGPGTQNQLAYYFLPPGAANGGNGEYGLNTAAGSILASPAFAATDARRTNFVQIVGSESFLKKYPTGTNTSTPYIDKAPVIRYAEVMLNLAEAKVRAANAVDAQALQLLNAVRTRSNPTGAYASFATAADMLDALLLERRIEFLGEGLRNIDIMRLNAPIPGKGSVSAVNPSDVLYVWPIPASELATNKLMTRN